MTTSSKLIVVTIIIAMMNVAMADEALPGGDSIPIHGESSWLLGANYPWNNYGGDFGENAWGYNGVGKNQQTIQPQFQEVQQNHGLVMRWWLFSDGRAGITFDGNGVPTGLDGEVFNDIDAAVAIAQASNVSLVLSLFDFYFLQIASNVNGVQVGGHSDCLSDPSKTQALINNVVIPVLSRYGSNSNILAWEVMNEPEWIISDLPQSSVNSQTVPVTLAQFYNFAAAITSAVHSNTNQYATLGSACLKWFKVWTPSYASANGFPALNLDFYQTHYYSWMDGQCENNDPQLGTMCFSPVVQQVSDLVSQGLDAPIVVGEFAGSTSNNLSGLFDSFLSNGYAGGWPWAVTGGSAEFTIDWGSYQTWGQSHQYIIHW